MNDSSAEMIINLFLLERELNNKFLKNFFTEFESDFKLNLLNHLTFDLNLEYYKKYKIQAFENIFQTKFLIKQATRFKNREEKNNEDITQYNLDISIFDLFTNVNGFEDIITIFLNLKGPNKKTFIEKYYGFKDIYLSAQSFLYVIYSLKNFRNSSIHELSFYKKKFIDLKFINNEVTEYMNSNANKIKDPNKIFSKNNFTKKNNYVDIDLLEKKIRDDYNLQESIKLINIKYQIHNVFLNDFTSIDL